MSHSKQKQGIQHYLIVLIIGVSVGFGMYKFVIPMTVQNAVIALFASNSHLDSFGGVRAEGKDKKSVETYTKEHFGKGAAKDTLKGFIKFEYIFDFTDNVRTDAKDGYEKKSGEFIMKAPGLGESAIVLEPLQAFTVLSVIFGLIFALLVTIILPPSLGFMSSKIVREIAHTKTKVRLQTGFSDEIVEILTLPNVKLTQMERSDVEPLFRKVWERTTPHTEGGAAHTKFDDVFVEDISLEEFREEGLYVRIREIFSEGVMSEILDTRSAIEWTKNQFSFMSALRLYMTHHFTHQYSNNVTGMAYLGAAILIVVIGVRGLKFIPATRPSVILAAISLEGMLLALLGFVLLYTQEEEPIDKVLKKVEDASRSQLETLKEQTQDTHILAHALVGGNEKIIQEKVNVAVTKFLENPDNLRGKIAEEIGLIVTGVLTQGLHGAKQTMENGKKKN